LAGQETSNVLSAHRFRDSRVTQIAEGLSTMKDMKSMKAASPLKTIHLFFFVSFVLFVVPKALFYQLKGAGTAPYDLAAP